MNIHTRAPLIALGVIVLIALSGTTGYYIAKKQPKQLTSVPQTSASPSLQATTTPSAAASPTATSSLTSLDSTWNKYTNNTLGFSINLPKKAYWEATCEPAQVNGQALYETKGGLIPIKAYEDINNNTVYIDPEYTIQTSKSVNVGDKTYVTTCEKIITTLALAKDDNSRYYGPGYNIEIKTINNDAELEQFLKQEYGKGCSLGAKKPAKQPGVFDVEIKGDGKDLGETECPINYITVVKYSPSVKKVAKWDVGQAVNFTADANFSVNYDDQINDSFRFN